VVPLPLRSVASGRTRWRRGDKGNATARCGRARQPQKPAARARTAAKQPIDIEAEAEQKASAGASKPEEADEKHADAERVG